MEYNINTIPPGVLSLLSIKELGKTPSLLTDTVQAQFDLTPHYLQRYVQTETAIFNGFPATSALTTGAKGEISITVAGTPTVVPNNEIWYVYNASLGVSSVAAADFVNAALCYITASSPTNPIMLTANYADVISARARAWVTPPMPWPMWVGPGTQFMAWVYDLLSAGGITLQLGLRATRLLI